MLKTAAVIIIGNEILSGKVKDENSHYLAQGLRELGVELSLVMVIPDRVPDIAEAVSMCSSRYDYVFTSGGIGPTHDDVTIQGIASAFGVKTEINRKLEEVILSRCGERPSDVALRMAELPQGAEVIELEGIGFPPVRMKNVFIFPGIPEFMRKKFDALKERFRSRPSRSHLHRCRATRWWPGCSRAWGACTRRSATQRRPSHTIARPSASAARRSATITPTPPRA